jgi:hypothetical protein
MNFVSILISVSDRFALGGKSATLVLMFVSGAVGPMYVGCPSCTTFVYAALFGTHLMSLSPALPGRAGLSRPDLRAL